ncbi:HK97 family phage prohead protease [Mesobacillus subterraneus]|uniref:HK97 family phage prohead protease n=1 Tax=Mesobacillus subterraneus TaxID=285983 RepID=UPI001CFF3772|nr:HK97 family phage prohead protease [Mesobacillus subterraneus]WLR54292.1 HK97 family phage prohead protease [Mesobacillus subterraneus]
MTKKRELRTIDITNLKTRDAINDQPAMISGYAAVFNSKTSIGDYFEEIIMPGAFSRSIATNSDIRALFNHDWNNVLGRTKSGTLRLSEDDRGLKFEVELPNTSLARDLAESMARGDINQCSFGFYIEDAGKETWDYSVEPALRTIHEVELFEISIVSLPAYDDTEAALVRSKEIDKYVEMRIKLINQIKGVLEK